MSHCFVYYRNWKLILSEQARPLVHTCPVYGAYWNVSWNAFKTWNNLMAAFLLCFHKFFRAFISLCSVSTRTHFQTCKLQNVVGVNFILSTTISKVFYSINCSFEMPTSTTVRARVCCWYLGLKRRAKRKRLQRWSSVQLSWRLCLPNLSRQSKPLH